MGYPQLSPSGRRSLQGLAVVLMALEFILANALLEDEMAALSSGSTWKEPEKRNTWWSKRGNAKEAGCYVDSCVPLVFECGRTSENSKSGFAKCRSAHSACLAQCVRNLNRISAALQK